MAKAQKTTFNYFSFSKHWLEGGLLISWRLRPDEVGLCWGVVLLLDGVLTWETSLRIASRYWRSCTRTKQRVGLAETHRVPHTSMTFYPLDVSRLIHKWLTASWAFRRASSTLAWSSSWHLFDSSWVLFCWCWKRVEMFSNCWIARKL